MVAVRLVITWIATWVALIALLFAPTLVLPDQWGYYVYSPASVGLWMLSMLIGPLVAAAAGWPWIRHGVRKSRASTIGT